MVGKINHRLQKSLAGKASLRKKDFDSMISEIQSQQEERHRQLKGALNDFVFVHKKAAFQLKKLLVDAQSGRAVDFRTVINEIQSRQDEAKTKVIRQLKSNQDEQEELMAEALKLLDDGDSIKVKDFKATLSRIKAKRIASVC